MRNSRDPLPAAPWHQNSFEARRAVTRWVNKCSARILQHLAGFAGIHHNLRFVVRARKATDDSDTVSTTRKEDMDYTPQKARASMVRHQIRCWDVLDQRVLDVLEKLPRDAFVADEYRRVAYADTQIPLAHGQVMMAPSVEGRMLQALDVAPGDAVLEIGCGSGFVTACLAALGGRVTSIDIHEDLVAMTARHLAERGIADCELKVEDAFSRSDSAKYDAIAVTGSIPDYRGEFDAWLKPGGRLFVIEGRGTPMEALLLRQTNAGVQRESLFETQLPPLLNAPDQLGFRF